MGPLTDSHLQVVIGEARNRGRKTVVSERAGTTGKGQTKRQSGISKIIVKVHCESTTTIKRYTIEREQKT